MQGKGESISQYLKFQHLGAQMCSSETWGITTQLGLGSQTTQSSHHGLHGLKAGGWSNRLGKETNSSSQLPLGYVSLQKKRYDILGHYMPIHVISNKIKEGAPPNSGKGNAGLPKAQIWLKIPKDTELWKYMQLFRTELAT